MDGESLDIKHDRLQRLKELFPEVFTENVVDWEKLKAAFGEDINFANERYVLNWAGKSDAFKVLQQPTTATLKPVPEESVLTTPLSPPCKGGEYLTTPVIPRLDKEGRLKSGVVDFISSTTQNLFIEGENLEALKVLQKAYYGKVKVVCIDPPYNTGSDSFIYPDRFSEKKEDYLKRIGDKDEEGFLMKEGLFRKNSKDSGHFHSNWLSMMYPRLFLAKNLLRDDGVIFVHIDDNEVHNLRMVMNEIFGEENFVTCLIWNPEGHTDNQFQVKVNHEYVLLYAKNSLKTNLGYIIDPNTRKDSNLWKGYAENSITKNGPGNPPSEVILPIGFPCKVSTIDISATKIESSFYKEVTAQGYISRALTQKYNVEYPIRKDTMKCRDGKLIQECRVYSGWANVNKLKEFISNDCNEILDDEGSKSRFYLSENGVIYYKKEREKARNILSVLRNLGTTEQMRSEIEEMGILFQYPKPKQLIKYLIQIGCDNNDIILDFFSGSATTAQAVMELNKEDGGSRKFILVQMPEPCDENSEAFKAGYKTIADIAKERIRRVIRKIENKNEPPLPLLNKGGELNISAPPVSGGIAEGGGGVDLGFKVFKLSPSNFKIWRGAEIDNEEKLSEQLDAFTNPIKPDAEKQNMLYELMLKAGYELAGKVEYITTPAPPYKGGELDLRFPPYEGGVLNSSSPPFQGGVSEGRGGLKGHVSNQKYLKEKRKDLRNNSTAAEASLWKVLQNSQIENKKFRRQHSVGNYILDFYCPECRLAIELDGAHHFTGVGSDYDKERDEYLQSLGIRILRIENKIIYESPEGVIEAIRQAILTTPLSPPCKGGELSGYYSINNGELIIVLDAMNERLVEQIIAARPQKVITLDSLFTGNDQLKTNTVLQMRDAGIDFKTI